MSIIIKVINAYCIYKLFYLLILYESCEVVHRAFVAMDLSAEKETLQKLLTRGPGTRILLSGDNMKTTGIIFSIFLFLIACTNSEEEKQLAARLVKFNEIKKKFHEFKMPTRNQPGIFGFYSAGCLDGGVSLPISGKGYQVLRISLRRYYGHPALIRFIKNLAQKIHTMNLGNILVGDMAMPRGGPMHYGHLSHQNGLDVDFAYTLIPDQKKKRLTIHEIENMKDPSVMTDDLTALNPDVWRASYVTVLRTVAEFDEVDRIFVNPFILNEICTKLEDIEEEDEEWIIKIRPWYGHHDHYHVRLKCPENNQYCVPQKELTKSACGDELEYWLTDDALERQKEYFKHQIRKKEDVPNLPRNCQAVMDFNDK